jgi:hypothetical protein
MKKPLIYVCHYEGYGERLKNLSPSYDYEIVSTGDGLDMPASNNVKHYAIMANSSDAIIIEDDTILPDDFDFERMVRETVRFAIKQKPLRGILS